MINAKRKLTGKIALKIERYELETDYFKISVLENWIKKAKSLGATECNINHGDYGDGTWDFDFIKYEEESDEQYEKRINREKRIEEQRKEELKQLKEKNKQKEFEQYLELKKKFEKE